MERQHEEWKGEQWIIKVMLEPRISKTLPWREDEHWRFDIILDPMILKDQRAWTVRSGARTGSVVSLYGGSVRELQFEVEEDGWEGEGRDDASMVAICGKSDVEDEVAPLTPPTTQQTDAPRNDQADLPKKRPSLATMAMKMLHRRKITTDTDADSGAVERRKGVWDKMKSLNPW